MTFQIYQFSSKSYVVGTPWNRLNEMIQMSTHNIHVGFDT